MAKTAQQMADAYARGMQGASTNYTNGVNAVTEAPTARAATPQAMDAYVRGVQESVSSGRRVARLQASTLQQWKDAAIKKGANNLSSGAALAMPKVQAHFSKWAPIYAQASAAVANLPKGGKANAMARVSAAMDVLLAAKGT